MVTHKVTLIPGDGTGPELVRSAVAVIEASGVKIDWEVVEAGQGVMDKYGTPLPENVLTSIRKNKVALKGPITTPIGTGFRSVNVALRQELNLYACVRPIKSFAGIKNTYQNVDLVVVRENTEDLYAGIEFAPGSPAAQEIVKLTQKNLHPTTAISLKVISRPATERIARFAFEYARQHNRKKVTAITKANIMKFSDGLFLEVSRQVARDYPDIEYEEKLVDNMCMQLVQKPQIYDILLLPNLYGDIISDLGAGLIGGLGVAPGANFGEGVAVFEAVHGSAPKYRGMDKVNPTALIMSAVMMLEYLGETAAARNIEEAVRKVIAEAKFLTYDLGGQAKTSEMTQAIIQKVLKQ